VYAVSDGLSALAAIRVNPPDVALFDIAMPVMTGDEALRQLRADGLTVPVVVMTASTNPQRFLQLGATIVLPKPFELTNLLAAIEAALPVPERLRAVGGIPPGAYP
jgi:CheY-like chemotaxis protein